MSFIAVYITCRDQAEANKISEALINDKLVACSNIYPIQSNYWWKGEVVAENEFVCLVKTTPPLWDRIKKEVQSLHSYETPCIMKFEVDANADYEAWIRENVKE